METGLKRAASSAIEVVELVTSELAPPITPARASGPFLSATTRSSLSSLRSWPSKVLNFKVSPARLIINEPSIFDESKA